MHFETSKKKKIIRRCPVLQASSWVCKAKKQNEPIHRLQARSRPRADQEELKHCIQHLCCLLLHIREAPSRCIQGQQCHFKLL